MKKTVRIPETRFENLADYPFSSHYLHVEEGLRLHYLDEGEKDRPIILLLHGEPSWSYLYRKMVPILSKAHFRVVVPDLIGFGKSDKLVRTGDYSYQRHLEWITAFIEQLDLKGITLFCQDWGGLLGLRAVTEMPDRFSAVIASNTTLPTGNVEMPEAFSRWREFSQKSPDFDIGKVIDMGTIEPLSEAVIAAYNAPFPSERYKAGARIFPTLVPIDAQDPESQKNRETWKKLMQWKKPFLTLFADSDPIMNGAEEVMQLRIPGAKGQRHQLLKAGHFIQEEKGEELAALIIDFLKDNGTSGP